MQENAYPTSLIQTKLHQLPLPVDLVPRPRLTEWLEQRRGRPLTLVSAPAGYGKSTLISSWLESVDCPTAWVSLDEYDNELRNFLHYFLTAVQSMFPNAVSETDALLEVTPLPPLPVIAHKLINELDEIEEPFILVFDDYHVIESDAVHDLLNELLVHPPRNLHLVLGTRMDPPLPLVMLRAKGQVTEIRVQDLRFKQDETISLFNKMIGVSLEASILNELEVQSEGWVTGLRLAALALHHRVGQDLFGEKISVYNRYVTDYLVTEILAKQAAILSDCMLKTSIFDRFCADLCEYICFQSGERSGSGSTDTEFTGERFLNWLQASNLFVIPLDNQDKWFRYHQLFQAFLQKELVRRCSPEEIAELHAAAGRWFAKNGWIEEALLHMLSADNVAEAINLIANHRIELMNTTQWPRLERWLQLFSAEVIEYSPELWMLKTWLVYQQGRWAELPAAIQHIVDILEDDPSQDANNHLPGEISSLRSLLAYHRGDAGEAISQARRALDILPPDSWIVRVMARMYLGGGLLLTGDENGGYHAFYGAFEEEKIQNKRFRATILMTACYFHWIAADLQSMEQAAKQALTLCQESGQRQILGQTNSHLGCVCYQRNDLEQAKEHFALVVARPYQNYGTSYFNSVCGLGMTYQAMGEAEKASAVIEEAIAFLLETGNTTLLPIVLALQAEAALVQGRLPAASQWAEKLDPVPPLAPMTWFLAPHLTLVKVWLAQNTPTSLGKADELLSKVQDYLQGIHNTRFLIETLALRALLEQARGEQTAALAVLEKALRLAQPGGFLRVFVDLGPGMARLLAQLQADRDMLTYVEKIRSAFSGSPIDRKKVNQIELLEPLTNREIQVLELLKDRLTNKEIATQLVISPGTVKGHTIQIYQKLDVRGRRQAVEKAIALGILDP